MCKRFLGHVFNSVSYGPVSLCLKELLIFRKGQDIWFYDFPVNLKSILTQFCFQVASAFRTTLRSIQISIDEKACYRNHNWSGIWGKDFKEFASRLIHAVLPIEIVLERSGF